jgi:hypothetical protein
MREWWSKIRALFRGRELAEDLREETSAHFQMEVDANLERGMSPSEAIEAAKRTFGNRTLIQEAATEAWVFRMYDTLLLDLRYALRSLRKNSGFTAVAILTLALGIGANTAIFSLVNQLLLHPSGISHPERVIAVRTRYGKQNLEFIGGRRPYSRICAIANRSSSMPRIQDNRGDVANFTGGDGPQALIATGVSAEWFDVFGARPLLGRVFSPEEDQPNRNRVVVLSHAAWTRLFAEDRG